MVSADINCAVRIQRQADILSLRKSYKYNICFMILPFISSVVLLCSQSVFWGEQEERETGCLHFSVRTVQQVVRLTGAVNVKLLFPGSFIH